LDRKITVVSHALESDVTSISQLTPFDRSSTVLIQDGMALLQSMNVKAFKTFGDLAEHFIKCQQQCFPSASDSVLQNRQGILVELVCWHLLQETFSSLELADHLSTAIVQQSRGG
jgi:hypothetical protein